jgi:hypothetical protein
VVVWGTDREILVNIFNDEMDYLEAVVIYWPSELEVKLSGV